MTRRAALQATAGLLAVGAAGLTAPPRLARAQASAVPPYAPGLAPRAMQGLPVTASDLLVEIAAFQSPSPFTAAGRMHLLYELHTINYQRTPLTLAAIVGVVWVAARIYRVGILMYGKRPTFPEIMRWVGRA